MPSKLYTPHDNQRILHQCTSKNIVIDAGRRFGKSVYLLNEGIYTILQLKRQICWLILPTYKQAKEIYWIDPDITRFFMPLVQNKILKKNDTELSLYCTATESWLRLKGSDNYDSLRGSGIDLAMWDEVRDMDPQSFETIKPALMDSPDARQIFTSTPHGLDYFHDLCIMGDHKGIIDRFDKPIKPDPDYQTFCFTSYDNMTWPEGSKRREHFIAKLNKERREAEEKGKLSFYMQEHMGSFEQSAGRFFPTWSYKTHVYTKPFDPTTANMTFSDIDWGRLAPMAFYTSAVLNVNYEGLKFNRIITFAEVYGGGKSPSGQADDIERVVSLDRVGRIYYDPSMDSKQDDGSISVADQFKLAIEAKIKKKPIMIPASNKRPPRWAAMDNWMRIAPDGLPYWMITSNCKNLIRTIPLMIPDDTNPEDIDTTLEDHGVDSISYGIQYVKWVDAGKTGAVNRPAVALRQDKDKVFPGLHIIDERKFAIMPKKNKDWKYI